MAARQAPLSPPQLLGAAEVKDLTPSTPWAASASSLPIHAPVLCKPAARSRWGGGSRERRGLWRRGAGRAPLLPAPRPRPCGLGKGSILRRGAPSIRPRDANEGERVPTARTLCRAAHLLLGERPLCPRQFTGNLACANGPAPLCGPRRHWPRSVGTAAAPGPQAPARRPCLYRGRGPRQPGTRQLRSLPPCRLASPSARHGSQHRGRGAAQPQREKPTAETGGGKDAPRPHQQQHRAVEAAAGAGVRAPPAQLQAREGRHPGDGRQLPETQQSLRRRRRRPQELAPGLQRRLLVVPAGGRAVPDAARGQRHADEAAVPFPATPGRNRRARQGAQGAQPRARACPGQGRRCCRCATARLWPLAALVTGETRRRPPSPQDKSAGAFLWRGKSLPIGCAASGSDAPLLRKALSLQAGRPAGESFSENVCRVLVI